MDRENRIVKNQIDFILAGLTLRKHKIRKYPVNSQMLM